MTDDDIPLTIVGMGPFPLPGEKKRRRKALKKAREELALVREIEERSKVQGEEDGDQ